ncbi:MAG: tRNA-dihydrouridine synthase, partial [Muribaculaceae bacterium]|nr:tRNA-dihydrouridine synthase [Muribaculaceae bacterium]
IQIYGRDAEAMVEAARIVEQARPDVLDINFGCPVKKVAQKGAGAGMLRDIPKMLDITRRVVQAVSIPVTVKTRLGWDAESKIITDLGPRLQDCGIKALTVHGRTRAQMYTGEADWELIGRLKADPRMEIPVIGNGDITSAEEARAAFDTYGVDGIMIGRAAFGQPWIFHEVRQYLDSGAFTPLSTDEKLALLRRQILESVDRIDEYRGILHIRRHLAATPLFKGLPNFRETRIQMLRITSLDELLALIDHIRDTFLSQRDASADIEGNDGISHPGN